MINWIKDRLPEEGKFVLVYDGYKYDIAKLEKGISLKERDAMRKGKIFSETIPSIGGTTSLRHEVWYPEDEDQDNRVPYCWFTQTTDCQILGQNVEKWAYIE